jgi:hypothetical protein
MNDSVDYYDVQRMVEDEARDRRANDDEIRELLKVRVCELLEEIASLERVLHSRTEHLA